MKKEIDEVLAENIRNLRQAMGLTRQDLADLSGLSARGIQSAEFCEKWPGIDTVKMIAKALKVSTVDLYSAGSTSGFVPIEELRRKTILTAARTILLALEETT